MVGIGSIVLTKDLILKSSLLVPSLTCNLLLVSKLTKDLNCVTNFHSKYCEFQDLESGRMIGNAEESARLYLLEFQIILKNKFNLHIVFPFQLL